MHVDTVEFAAIRDRVDGLEAEVAELWRGAGHQRDARAREVGVHRRCLHRGGRGAGPGRGGRHRRVYPHPCQDCAKRGPQ